MFHRFLQKNLISSSLLVLSLFLVSSDVKAMKEDERKDTHTYKQYWKKFLPKMGDSFRDYNKSTLKDDEILGILFKGATLENLPALETAKQKFLELAKGNRPYAKLFNPPLTYKQYWKEFLPKMGESFRIYNKSTLKDDEILALLFSETPKGQFPDLKTAKQKFLELAKGNRPYAKLFNPPEEIENNQNISISQNIIPAGPLVSFYLNEMKTPTSKLTITDIHKASWLDLEKHHDYIQLLFPLREASGAVKTAPILAKNGPEELQFRKTTHLQDMVKESLLIMLNFYGLKYDQKLQTVNKADHFNKRADVWLKQGNHNHLRITRILKSLRILGLNEYAQAFFTCLKKLYNEGNNKDFSKISKTSFHFWEDIVLDKSLDVPQNTNKTMTQIQKFNEVQKTLLTSQWGDKTTVNLNDLHKDDYISGFGTAQKGFDAPNQPDNNGYAWLSNYYVANSLNPNSKLKEDFSIKVKINGQVITFKSVETAYQIYKLYSHDKINNLKSNMDPLAFSKKQPNDARNAASHIKKYNFGGGDKFMYVLLQQKFINHPAFTNALVQTGEKLLLETNMWGDKNWGMEHDPQHNTLSGSGKLGKMEMQIRQEIKANPKIPLVPDINLDKFL